MRWKSELETKGLRVNMGKTKILCSSYGVNQRTKTGKWPCGVCRKGVGVNSIYCNSCKHWIHKRCSGTKGKLMEDAEFKCKNCINSIPLVEPTVKVLVGEDHLDMVKTFCYLGDVVGNNGGCADAITNRVRGAWKKFRELLPILTNRAISLHIRGHVFSAAVRSVLLHASETWPMTSEEITRIVRNDNSMVRWICSKKLSDRCSMSDLHTKLKISNIVEVLRQGRLRWFGHIMRLNDNLWQKKILSFHVDGAAPRGRPKMRWIDNVNQDMRNLGIRTDLTDDRVAWRLAIK